MTQPIQKSAETRVLANGIQLSYDTFGDPADPPLLLIMGLGAQMIAWDEEFCTLLAEQGYWVIRFDNRDVGLSTRQEAAGVPEMGDLLAAMNEGAPIEAPYLLRDMAADAVGLLDALGIERAHVVGLSLGGMIAQEMAIRHGGRLRTMTSIMSSMGPAEQPPPTPEALNLLLRPPAPDRATFIENAVEAIRVFNGTAYPLDEDRIREREGRYFDRGLSPTGSVRQMAALLASGSRRAALQSISVPTLVIHGEADPLVPVEGGHATAETIPGAEMLAIEGMGHYIPPDLWPRVINAIARHAA